MKPERWTQVKNLLDDVLERQAGEREDYLHRVCGEDQDLIREVRSLLAVEPEATTFIETPAFRLRDDDDGPFAPGRIIDRYRIVDTIGRGGMGAVFRAVRDDDEYQQKVALKVLKRGLDTDEIVGRFRRERQILANLEHPNIARLLDGGTTAEGLPYLVMELIEGQPVDQWADDQDLSLAERLVLFRQVCDAVQTAHRSLVVHRDLKPSNILVIADGTPKLLDFGIAKLLSTDQGPTLETRAGFQFLTPQYASPEQVLGDPVTTASDVYALGLLLYLLLTGDRPYEATGWNPEQLQSVLHETPSRPSQAARPQWKRAVAGDLDNIVLTALRKEPERRYATVDQLSEDVRRYLEGLPVSASGDSWRYRTGKFLGRHRLGVGFAALLLAVILGASGVILSLYTEAQQSYEEAEESRQTAEQAQKETDTALKRIVDIFEVRDIGVEDPTALDLLHHARDEFLARVGSPTYDDEEARVDFRFMNALIDAFKAYGRHTDAIDLAHRRIDLQAKVYSHDEVEVADGYHDLAELLRRAARYEEALEAMDEGLRIERLHRTETHPEVLTARKNRALLLAQLRNFGEAQAELEAVLAAQAELFGESRSTASARHNLGLALLRAGKNREAIPYLEKALEVRRQLAQGEPDMATVRTLNVLASAEEGLGDLEGAETRYREALRIYRQVNNLDPNLLVAPASNLARLLTFRGEFDEAALLLDQAVEAQSVLPEDHRDRILILRNLASLALEQEDLIRAQAFLERARSIHRRQRRQDRLIDAVLDSLQGAIWTRQGRFEAAQELLLSAYLPLLEAFDWESLSTRQTRQRLIRLYEAWGRPEEAERYRQRPASPPTETLGTLDEEAVNVSQVDTSS